MGFPGVTAPILRPPPSRATPGPLFLADHCRVPVLLSVDSAGDLRTRTLAGLVVVYYCRTYVKAVRGGRVKRGDVCYGMLQAAPWRSFVQGDLLPGDGYKLEGKVYLFPPKGFDEDPC